MYPIYSYVKVLKGQKGLCVQFNIVYLTCMNVEHGGINNIKILCSEKM